jgi:hypothetical protein
MARMQIRQTFGLGIMGVFVSFVLPSPGWAQGPKSPAVVTVEQPDAQHVKDELSALLDHYPPSLRNVLVLDPGLLENQSYLAPYPALVNFFNAHPEIARTPSFYFADAGRPSGQDHATQVVEMWREGLSGLAIFAGFGMGIGLLVWLIRTLVDYRRWNRLAKVQTDVHTKLLDRFTANNDVLAYIQSPAGSKFLQSTPIMLDAAPRSVGAPLGRILWSVQGGVVLMAGGIGLQVVSGRVADEASQPLHALGVLGIALGLGFVVSAITSFVISHRLGLIEPASPTLRTEMPGVPGTQE